MDRVQRLIVSLVVCAVCVSSSALAGKIGPDTLWTSQAEAYAACVQDASSHDTTGGGFCRFNPGGNVSARAECIQVNPAMGDWTGSYSSMNSTKSVAYNGFYWCVSSTCSGNSASGYRIQNDVTAPASDGSSCCVTWVSESDGDAPVYCWAGNCREKGHYTRTGSRCINDFDWRDPSLGQKRDDTVCDGVKSGSCYDPHKDAFCGTTEYGESVCVPRKTPAPGGCISGATGAICVGSDGNPPPKPSDPPVPPNKPPDATNTGSVTDSNNTTNNYTTNNYSGTSTGGSGTGDGSGSGSGLPGGGSSSGWPGNSGGSTGGQSNANGSGNSGPAGSSTSGGAGSGKCSDGSVPTASGCSGTVQDNGCDSPPQCFGDAVLCGQYREQHATRCATQKLAAASGSSSAGPDEPADVAGALAGAGIPADGGESSDPEVPTIWDTPESNPPPDVDASGFGWSRSCPANPKFSFWGKDYEFDVTPFCTMGGKLGWLIVWFASLLALRIVSRGG